MNILFYYPFNKRTIPIDVPLFELKQRGHNIILLTLSEKGLLHEFYEKNGISTYTHKKKSRLGQILELVTFCNKKKIDVVHSHLQQSNLIAILASLFLSKTRVIPFRHHCKFHHLVKNIALKPPKKEVLADRIINRLANQIIVPASAVKTAMVERENASEQKIKVIPYIYHFDKMQEVSQVGVESIRATYPSKILILMISRMTPFKRHKTALEGIIPLIQNGHDIQLLIMDTGPLIDDLKAYVSQKKVADKIHFLGFRSNILDFIAASDIIVHPSITDASNSVIKEAALFEKLVAVCDEVGDFNDYIIDKHNGFLLSAEDFAEQCKELLLQILNGRVDRSQIGSNLKEAVLAKFSFNQSVVDKYESL